MTRIFHGAISVRIRNSAIERWLAGLVVMGGKSLFATARRRFHYVDPETSPYQQPGERTFIYSVWHDSLLMPLLLGRQPSTVALIGMHQDGAFLAHAMKLLNIPAVRGSSSRGGAEAVSQLIEQTANHHIVVTPDGPRGPRREMKQGIAFLASRTGKPVVPTAFACRSAWSIGTGWTDLAVPKPFTIIHAFAGEAIVVPADADKQTLRSFTQKIQDEMDRLNALATATAAGQPVPDLVANLRQAA